MVITACGKIKPDSICKFLFFYHLLRQPPSARDPTNIMPTTAVVAHAAAAPVAPFPPVAAAAAVAAATGVAVPSRDAALAALNAADNTTVRKFLHNRLKTRRSAPFPVAAPRADKLHVAELDLRTELKVNRAKTLSKAQWQTAFPKTRRDPFAAVIHAGRALSAIVERCTPSDGFDRVEDGDTESRNALATALRNVQVLVTNAAMQHYLAANPRARP